jgi:hypothetical protein
MMITKLGREVLDHILHQRGPGPYRDNLDTDISPIKEIFLGGLTDELCDSGFEEEEQEEGE